MDVIAQLDTIAPVIAVAGNNDPPELVERLGISRVVQVDGVRIGVTHGHAGTGSRTPDRAASLFTTEPVDVVAFGHSHIPGWERRDGLWLLNPGSPTDRRRMPAYSYAILEVAPAGDARAAARDRVSARIAWYADRTPGPSPTSRST